MGTLKRNKPGSDAASDSISADSLSFAALVSIQDKHQHHPNHPAPKQHYHHVIKQDPDFEFAIVKAGGFNSAANPFKNITPADILISNGQIKAHAIAFQPHRSNFFTNPPISLRSLLAIEQHIGSGETSSNAPVKARNLKNKETTVTTKTWFGEKVLKSFTSPCRRCEAVQPGTIKGQGVFNEKGTNKIL